MASVMTMHLQPTLRKPSTASPSCASQLPCILPGQHWTLISLIYRRLLWWEQEGELRPQLLDRFGLSVSVATMQDTALRKRMVLDRLAYDSV